MKNKFLNVAVAVLSLGAASPALAASVLPAVKPANWPNVAPVIFDFTKGSNTNVQDGNARYFTASSVHIAPITVKVTGWSLEKTSSGTYVRDSKLMVYDGGLGIVSGDDDNGTNNQHTVDNEGRKDFMILQFDMPVRLLSATFNTYSVLGKPKDSDATIKWGTTSQPFNTSLGLDGRSEAYLNSLFDGSLESLSPVGANGASNTRAFETSDWGNLWLIGASFKNADGKIDGFKLTNLAAIPEPATWMTLILGFGVMGSALRAARRREAALAAA